MKKNFVLDTNVMLHDPQALESFEENVVVVPIYAIEEIDRFKKDLSDLGRNARAAARLIDHYRELGNLEPGVPLACGGLLRVVSSVKNVNHALDKHTADNMILSVALEVQAASPGVETIMVTKDTNLRIRANAVGLQADDFMTTKVDIDDLYPGATEITIDGAAFEALFEDGEAPIDFIDGTPAVKVTNGKPNGEAAPSAIDRTEAEDDDRPELYPNEYLLLRNEDKPQQTALSRLFIEDRVARPLRRVAEGVWGVKPRNKEQHFALDALMDEKIQLVTLLGKAGTGKTLLAIAAGLQLTADEEVYRKMLVARPIFPLGRDIGYLPGDVGEKLNPWMQPIHDNIAYLMELHRIRTGRHIGTVNDLIQQGVLGLEPLTFIRGRSLPSQYMLVDEAQNLTPHEVKTILTRAGDGTKVVLTGDPYQIDNPYVDAESNGLTYTINRFKGQPLAATITLHKGERSELAELAANLL
jgi:PhoH-like ATPase